MTRRGLRLEADFSEDAVGFAIEGFLSVLGFPKQKFTIEPFSRQKERWLGADARLIGRARGFKPFYMQFKRPSAYPSGSNSKIILDRKNMQPTALDVDPCTLFFSLRNKQPNHSDYQHNVLFRLSKRLRKYNLGDAAYVCPLFLDRSTYRMHSHLSALMRWPLFWKAVPWDLRRILIHMNGQPVSAFDVPVLAEHVCVPPHVTVTHARHSYSFTDGGTQLCFHSPEHVQENPMRLDKWVSELVEGVENIVTFDSSARIIKEIFQDEEWGEELPFPRNIFDDENGIVAWLHWGDYLKRTFSIEQFAIIYWEK